MELRAEMAANVWQVLAKEGQVVHDGEPLLILESMKMEIPLFAEGNVFVDRVVVAEGDAVQEGDVLALLRQGC